MSVPPMSIWDRINAWFAREPLVGAAVAAGAAALTVHELENRGHLKSLDRGKEEEDE